MAKIVQVRRGTTAALSSVTGAEGELFVDTDKETLTVLFSFKHLLLDILHLSFKFVI